MQSEVFSSFVEQPTMDTRKFEPSHNHRPQRAGNEAGLIGGVRQTVRRGQLRAIVPLADSTIYRMEQQGEFPRRFNLTPRCVVWDLAEVQEWLRARRSDSDNGKVNRAPGPDVKMRKIRPVHT